MAKLSKEKVTIALIRKNMSWKDLAAALGRSYSAVRTWFRNEHNTTTTIGSVAKVLGVQPEDIMDFDDDKQ